jgi:ADP-ribose pyrophosphatase YjhB (NUDIX family)
MSDISARLNLWTQRLTGIAQTGLAFDPHAYDRERYEELLKLAAEMAATTAALEHDQVLSQQLYERWRSGVGERERGYVTPKVGVGAVVFNERDELLLIRRAISGMWLYPTGWADVGYTPAQVAVKEVWEETGLRITPLRIIALYDNTRYRSTPDNHFWSVTFYCRLDGGDLHAHPHEVLALGFFAHDRLPAPLAREGLPWAEHAFAAHRGDLREPYFDPVNTES